MAVLHVSWCRISMSRPPKWTSPPSGDSPAEAWFKWMEAVRMGV